MRRTYSLCILPVLMLVLFLAAGCGSKEPVQVDMGVVKKALLEKKWFCKQLFQRDVAGDNPLTIQFMPDGTVIGSGGCNEFKGTYTLTDDSLTFGPLTTTKKSCGPAADEQEFTYFSFLARINKFKVEEDQLELFADSEVEPMLFSTSEGGSIFSW